MRIEIKEKLRPFSHCPGVRCLLPHTTWEAQIFPAKAILRNLSGSGTHEIALPFGGPVKGFTAMLDMEKGQVEVYGRVKERIILDHPEIKKTPQPPNKKRLFLGCTKKQDWELVSRRLDMAEIFPFWLRLSQLIPEEKFADIGTGTLLKDGRLDLFFQAGFQGILSPRFNDENFLGICEEVKTTLSPLGLIHEGARQIEKMFFYEEGDTLHFLPKLPKEFHAGRLIHLITKDGDRIDLSWSKKELKKVIIFPAKEKTIRLGLQTRLKSFRVRKDLRKSGELFQKNAPLELQKNQVLYLDRFSH